MASNQIGGDVILSILCVSKSLTVFTITPNADLVFEIEILSIKE